MSFEFDQSPPTNELQALLSRPATKTSWRQIIKHLQLLCREENPGELLEQQRNAALTWTAEATASWPAWVRYAELPKQHPFPCPGLVGELYATIKGWDDPLYTTALPRFDDIETLSLNIPLAQCDALPTDLLAPFPHVHKCILWAGHADNAVEDPIVVRNAFWALQQASEALFPSHEDVEIVEINAIAEIDLIEDSIFMEAFASKRRGEPWYTEEHWENYIAQWQELCRV